MKRIRLPKWSDSHPLTKTRPCCLRRRDALITRFQSTAISPVLDNELPIDSPPNSPPTLVQYPPTAPTRSRLSARLSALHARLSLPPPFPVETLSRCLTDATAESNSRLNNSSLALLGSDLLGYYTSESIICKYPRLPMPVVYAAMYAYVGPKTLAAITREWGIEIAAEPGDEVDPGYLRAKRVKAGREPAEEGGGILRQEDSKIAEDKGGNERRPWRRGVSSWSVQDGYFGDEGGAQRRTQADYAERPELRAQDLQKKMEEGVTLEQASSSFVKALLGSVYLYGGRAAAKAFFADHFLSRQLDVKKLFAFRQPTRDLSRLCAREGFESPIARILSETGRTSRHPVFVVGVFSGKEKMGEGAGGSLDEARIRAAVAALKGWYLYSPLEVRVPSDVEEGNGKKWEPVHIDGGDIIV